ncbi:MAG: tRNA (N6-threonylcarbamoyladenosine(37)-N6)-methyltransferase TrmO [Pseudomonadota bacterium]
MSTMNAPVPVSLTPIGVVRSPFREKFGVPRQAGLAPAAEARVELYPPYDEDATVAGLEAFSHLWLIFHFHHTEAQGWRATVRPPRLGGNAKVGVYASRSPFRPNPLGLSAVELLGIERQGGRLSLRIAGADLVDGTPVFDIKPYLTYADSLPDARAGYADEAPMATCEVRFSPEAQVALAARRRSYPQLEQLIVQVLQADPRPAYRGSAAQARRYGMRLLDFDLRWRVEEDGVVVEALADLDGPAS